MSPRINLKYEHMVDPGRPPAVGVDAKQENVQNHNKHASIHSQRRLPGIFLLYKESWKRKSATINDVNSRNP